MDHHYSYCENHDAQWHTITSGDACPFCKLEKANVTKPPLCDVLSELEDEFNGNGGLMKEACETVLSKYFA